MKHLKLWGLPLFLVFTFPYPPLIMGSVAMVEPLDSAARFGGFRGHDPVMVV